MPAALDPLPLLRFLHERGVEHIIIGGVAVNAHGLVRPSEDLDIVPDPSAENLGRLAVALKELNARNNEAGDFDDGEFPFDPTSVEDLSQGGNFRLVTDQGQLDVLQWIGGIDVENLYAVLAEQAVEGQPSGVPVRVCGLAHLRAMKQAAGRPRDLDDLQHLPEIEDTEARVEVRRRP
jgi:predicted nucleotidyltransferase